MFHNFHEKKRTFTSFLETNDPCKIIHYTTTFTS